MEVIKLWPGNVPGETEAKHPPVVTDDHSKNVIRITNVTDPLLTVYPAPAAINNGASVVICPGGGYNILAINHEGDEIAQWLNTLGFNAYVLQYRVPKRQAGALNDAQRAIRIVRNDALKRKNNPETVGIMGFSAGGSLSARASTLYNIRTYEPVDNIDSLSCRPSFALLIYPAYLDKGEFRSLTPELKVNKETPPMFLFATADDAHGNSVLVMSQALRDAKVPVELHFLPVGGHGYGLRPGNPAGEKWPIEAASWLKQFGTLKK